jgi:hypothetical protein
LIAFSVAAASAAAAVTAGIAGASRPDGGAPDAVRNGDEAGRNDGDGAGPVSKPPDAEAGNGRAAAAAAGPVRGVRPPKIPLPATGPSRPRVVPAPPALPPVLVAAADPGKALTAAVDAAAAARLRPESGEPDPTAPGAAAALGCLP